MNVQRLSCLTLAVFIILLSGCTTPSGITPTSSLPTSSSPTTQSTTPSTESAQHAAVIIDTDVAIDDWMAILYTLQRQDVNVLAITVAGTGEAHCAAGVQHALGLIAVAGYNKIPVACGRETPLQGNHVFPEKWRQEADTLKGVTLPTGQNPNSSQTAVALLSATIKSSPSKVKILTLGPLTNIAETLKNNPELKENIEGIFIMGGAVDVPGNISKDYVAIENKVAEWNLYIDPVASDIVFTSGIPITLITLDATNHVPLTMDFYNRLAADHRTPEASLVYDFYTQNQYLITGGTIQFWDQLAAAILTEEKIATFDEKNLCIIDEEGPENGRTKLGDGCSKIRVAVSADKGLFQQVFLDTLNSTSQ